MKKIIHFFKRLAMMLTWHSAVEAGICDFSGQGRDAYGR